MTNPVLKRVVRRETHSPRTMAMVIVLVVIIVGAVLTGIEIVLRMSGSAALLVAPGAATAWAEALPVAEPGEAVIAGASAVVLAGFVLLWFALAPGRRPKHSLGVSEHAVIVDNAVIASAIAERMRQELDLPRGAVIVGIGHRAADVRVRPEPGQLIDRAQVRSIAEGELVGYSASPRLKVRASLIARQEKAEMS